MPTLYKVQWNPDSANTRRTPPQLLPACFSSDLHKFESGAGWGVGSCPHLPTRGDANVCLHDCMLRIRSAVRLTSSSIESMMSSSELMWSLSASSGEQLDLQAAVSTTVVIINSSSSIQQYNSYLLLIDFVTPEWHQSVNQSIDLLTAEVQVNKARIDKLKHTAVRWRKVSHQLGWQLTTFKQKRRNDKTSYIQERWIIMQMQKLSKSTYTWTCKGWSRQTIPDVNNTTAEAICATSNSDLLCHGLPPTKNANNYAQSPLDLDFADDVVLVAVLFLSPSFRYCSLSLSRALYGSVSVVYVSCSNPCRYSFDSVGVLVFGLLHVTFSTWLLEYRLFVALSL